MNIFKFLKKDKPVAIQVKPNIITQEFPKIEKFDKDEYINDTFISLFHSIQVDNEWKRDLYGESIKFTKTHYEQKDNNYTGLTIVVSIHFNYKFKSNKFTIESITLKNETSYDSDYSYKGVAPDDVKSFLYEIYSKWINELNLKEKAKVDKSLSYIKTIIGKSAERDSKISNIIN
jgi:hypothetical protein